MFKVTTLFTHLIVNIVQSWNKKVLQNKRLCASSWPTLYLQCG